MDSFVALAAASMGVLIVILAILVALYVLSSIAIMRVLKILGYANVWMAWIPFLNYFALANVTADADGKTKADRTKAGGRSGVRVCIEEKSGDKTGVRRTEKSGDKKRSRQSGESRIAKETGIERKYGSGQFGSDGKGDGFDENFTDRAAADGTGRNRKKSGK